jgi:cobalamin biosynthesis Co2+ chelatase CbiK
MERNDYKIRYEELTRVFDEFMASYNQILIEKGQLQTENDLLKRLLDQKNTCPLFNEKRF